MSSRTRTSLVLAFALVLLAAPAMAQVIAPAQPLPRYTINATARALDSIADITGDGIRDLILGNPDADQVQLRNGRNGNLIAQFNGPTNSSFGFDVASTGDVDGDGLEDVLIGAPDALPDGLAFLYSSATFAPVCTWGPSSAGAFDSILYGYSVSRAGDLNGSGAEEVLVGGPMFDPVGTSRPGLVEAVDVTPCTALLHTIVGMANWEQFGDALASLGDVDGDAVDDFIVGATWFFGPNGTSPGTVPGIARIYSGASMNFPPGMEVLIQQLNGNAAADAYGFAVAGIGDLDNDGAGDWLVGAPDFAQLSVPFVDTAFYTIPSPTPPALYCLHFGHAVSGVGDFNGNGFEDFVVGAPSRFGSCGGAAGRVYLYEGRNATVIFQLSAPGASGEYGWDVTELDQVAGRTLIAVADPAAGQVHVF